MRRSSLVGLSLLLSLFMGAHRLYAQDGQRNIKRDRPAPQKWALLIGVDDYSYANKLESCGRDMRALYERLRANDFPERQMFLLHDKADRSLYRPVKENIEDQLDLLLGKVDEHGKTVPNSRGLVEDNDLVVVGFSGHGVLLDGVSYLCPVGTKLGEPKTLVSVEGIYNRLSACRASQKLLIIDACRNDPRPGGQKGPRATNETQGFAKSLLTPPEGILVLASCAPGQVSWEDPKELGHGVFMHFVLKGLAGEAKDKDGKVTVTGLWQFANRETKLYVAHHYGELQTPELFGKLQGDFAIGPVGDVAGGALPAAIVPAPLDCTGAKGVSAAEVKKAQEVWAKYLGRQPEEVDVIAPGVQMKFVLVPPGKFLMGSPKGEKDQGDDEAQHEVTITQPFYLGRTEVTQEQYQALGMENKSKFRGAASLPVENVSWEEADAFARALSQKNAGAKLFYRLPTEAEWEYACRGGRPSSSPFGIGRDGTSLSSHEANFDGKDSDGPYGGAKTGPYLQKTSPVGKYDANALGLFDMHGNVWEWCWDWHGAYPGGKVTDPKGPAKGSLRVCRGGCWADFAMDCRAAGRNGAAPGGPLDKLGPKLGFRLVRIPPGK
jgi:formylglycine-generating enzyme required for sulfatase activity/uncharacterized caspase-like protein